MSENNFLEVRNLTIHYETKQETVYAVNDVSFSMKKGETLGLVGETGAGKTTIARAILGILPVPPAVVKGGEILLNGNDVLKMSEKEMHGIRGKQITMIFQDPMTALNPVMTVGRQIEEVVELHEHLSKHEAKKRAEEMLEMVGIPAGRYGEYPHQFSGGMKQRVVIAMALACNPDLLLADEPTTALDVTIQAQVLDLMRKLNKEKDTSCILITHDLGVVAEMCDKVAVVYAGQILEAGSLEDIFDHPSHPYTVGLFGAIPSLDGDEEMLHPVPGMTPNPADLPSGCKFHPRCKHCTEECKNTEVLMKEIAPGHFCRCLHMERGNR
ncbi:ABC transporter ATP-binding protein [Clostridium sp. AM45-5]|nr:ABC transporter ATP-binding protein [Clostridium sp. AM45-5]RHS64349.1 ABC transporter ATP-binding protein [Clostridium sp. AM45-5]